MKLILWYYGLFSRLSEYAFYNCGPYYPSWVAHITPNCWGNMDHPEDVFVVTQCKNSHNLWNKFYTKMFIRCQTLNKQSLFYFVISISMKYLVLCLSGPYSPKFPYLYESGTFRPQTGSSHSRFAPLDVSPLVVSSPISYLLFR